MTTHTYRNTFHNPHDPQYGPREYTTDAVPVEYCGFLIFERIPGKVWDVVRNGECITQRAGLQGAKDWIGYESQGEETPDRMLRAIGLGHRKPYRLRNSLDREIFELSTGALVGDMSAEAALEYAKQRKAAIAAATEA